MMLHNNHNHFIRPITSLLATATDSLAVITYIKKAVKKRNKVISTKWQDYLHVKGITQCASTVDCGFSKKTLGNLGSIDLKSLAGLLKVGDIIFIQVKALPFKKVSQTTASWTNHVGIVVDISGHTPVISESTFPLSKSTSLASFIARSRYGRVAVHRLNQTLFTEQHVAISMAAQKRLGILYDTGFNIHSRRQFCSRYVREVLAEATGSLIGEIESFQSLFTHNPTADMAFWRLWYFGRIPWRRQTVTPASLFYSPLLQSVFNGYVAKNERFLKKSVPITNRDDV